MPALQSFTCPTCAAPITITGDTDTVRCEFCENIVVVPPEFRHKKFASPPPQVNFTPQVAYSSGLPSIYQPTLTSGYTIVAAIIVIVGVVGGLAYYFVAQSALEARSRVSPTQSAFAAQPTHVSFSGSNTAEAPRATPTMYVIPTLAPTATSTGFASVVQEIGSEGTGTGHFQDLRSIAVDGNGNIYTGEYSPGRIQKFDSTGKFITSWMPSGSSVLRGIAADRAGNVYVTVGGKIQKYDGTGTLLKTFGTSSSYYDDVVVMADGILLVADTNAEHDDIVKVNATTGTETQRFKKAISSQSDRSELDMRLAVDGLGTIYTLGTFNKSVFVFNSSGKFQTRVGDYLSPESWPPEAIGVDSQSRVYISTVVQIDVFSAKGTAQGAFKVPNHQAFQIVFNDQGDMFVAARDRIYKLKLNAP